MEIDAVLSGGGIKGYALIGAYEVLEKQGFTFNRLAGTSAGALMAAFMAAGYSSKEIFSLMEETDLHDFLDARKTIIPFSLAKWLLLYWKMGMYQGNSFEQWIREVLGAKGIYTFSDLPKDKLRLIASDLSTGRMIVLPDDLEQYGIPQENFPVARAIRMSCSLPYFFEPIQLRSLAGENVIVDGGILSNFPIWVLQSEHNRKPRPILGIKLSYSNSTQPKRVIKNGLSLFEALFTTMKDAHDTRYISRKHEKDIIFIPMEGESASEFTLTEEKKNALMQKGRERTEQFLKKWTY